MFNTKSKQLPVPRAVTADELKSIQKLTALHDKVGAGAGIVFVSLFVYAIYGGPHSESARFLLLVPGLFSLMALCWCFVAVWGGNLAVVPAPLTTAHHAWLAEAKATIPAVAEFLATVEAQDRNLLRSEFESLVAYYDAQVYTTVMVRALLPTADAPTQNT